MKHGAQLNIEAAHERKKRHCLVITYAIFVRCEESCVTKGEMIFNDCQKYSMQITGLCFPVLSLDVSSLLHEVHFMFPFRGPGMWLAPPGHMCFWEFFFFSRRHPSLYLIRLTQRNTPPRSPTFTNDMAFALLRRM